MTSVFLDCEFDTLESPRLLSIGLVASDGRELYAELSDPALLDAASEFVLDTVVPQLGLMQSAVQTQPELGRVVGDWLIGLGDGPIAVHYDYHSDFDLLEAALEAAGLWSRMKDSLTPTHIGYLIGESDVEAAMEASWSASFAADGIQRHHALADARALRAGYEAMHGTGPVTHPCRFGGESVPRITLDVPVDMVDYAKRFGGKFDESSGTWYVEGTIPSELTNLVRRPTRTLIVNPSRPVPAVEVLTCLGTKVTDSTEDRQLFRLALEKHGLNVERAVRWFRTKMVSLGHRTPSQAVSSPEGRAAVENLLRRLHD